MIGKTISHYKIIEKLGGGGMGVVYKAYDIRLKRHVALKFLSSEMSHDEEAKMRFMREAQAASALDHSNICNVHEIDQTDDGQLFICMTLYEGDTIKKKIQDGPLPINEVVTIALQIAQGLARAHKADIFHRDLKPANIMLSNEGEVKIVDFGLAKLAGQQDLTKEHSTIGTVAYMSPEQVKGQTIDHRTDIWSFGVILHELLTGKWPFKGEYDPAVIYSILNEEPEAIEHSRKDVPVELINIITRCLMKDPKNRYASMEDIVRILQKDQRGITPVSSTHMLETVEEIFQRIKRYRIPIIVIFFLFMFFGVWEIFFSLGSPRYLVVLPFRVIGEESIDDFYRDGLLDIISSKLTRLEQFQDKLWVISGSEVRNNRLNSVAEAHDLVGADLAITGSIGQSNGRLRFILNLVETESFVQLKSMDLTVDRNAASVAETKILASIIDMLDLELVRETGGILYAGGTNLPDAYDYYVQGRGYLTHPEDIKNIETAVSLFNLALNTDSTFLLAHTGLGEAYWQLYKAKKDPKYVVLAKASCRKAMGLEDEHAEVYTTCGMVYSGIGEYEKAVETLKKALFIDPNSITASLQLGRSYFNMGKLELARETYEAAIKSRPGYWLSYSYLGYFYYATGKYEKAVEQYQKIVELLPQSNVGYKKLAVAYFQMNKREEFIAASKKAMQIKPTYSIVNNLAVFYYYSGEYKKAVEMFKEVLKFNINDYPIYGNIASACYYTDQRDSSRVYYLKAAEIAEEARKINPRDDQLLSDLASYYAGLDSTNMAFHLLNQVKKLEPKNISVLFNIGDVYEQLGERDSALFWMSKALKSGATMVMFEQNPGLQDLIADERFKEILSQADSID